MKKWFTSRGMAVAATALCASMPSAALDVDLGSASPYAAFIFGDMTSLVTATGRVAVGGNLSLSSASVGAELPASASMPTLVVKGDVTYQHGALRAGPDAGYGVLLGAKSPDTSGTLDLRVVTSLPIDFDSERVYLTAMSEQLRDLGPTGQTALAGGTLRLAGTGASLEVFQVTAAQFAGAQAIVLVDVAPEAHLVINVDADATSRLTFGLDTAALSAWKGRVLVNAHDAEIVTFSGQTLWSSLLAPVACVCNGTGRIEGSVVARKWTSAVSVSYTPFVPKN